MFVELYPDDLVEAAIELWGEQLLKGTYEPKPVRRVEIPKPDGSLLCLAGSSRERCYQSDKEAIPYSSAALRQDLERLRNAWLDCQATRDRNAIYGYLTAVYGLVAVWTMEGREIDRARRALRLQRLKVSDREDPFAAVIRCTADPAKADKRTKSKWSRVMRYAVAYKPDSEPLDRFIKRKGGINTCAARFSRRLGRGDRSETAE